MGGAVIIENYASATACAAQTKALTLQDIERMAKLLGSMPPEPIGEWMRQLGQMQTRSRRELERTRQGQVARSIVAMLLRQARDFLTPLVAEGV